MTAIAHQVAAQELGAGRWRVELEVAPAEGSGHVRAGGAVALSVHPADAESPPARVETVAPPTPAASERWSVVVALERPLRLGALAVYDVSGGDRGGWAARVELARDVEVPAPERRGGGDDAPRADIDYRARDFDALRGMMLRLIDQHVSGGLVGHPVAQSTALVEELAYLGDALSYQQDALATEAYLVTARHRTSVSRHAALLDYSVFEGMSARAWVRVEVTESLRLPAGTRLATRVAALGPSLNEAGLATAVAGGALVFETLQDADLQPGPRRLPLAGGLHAGERLGPGATRATVTGPPDGLAPGALILLEPAPPGAQRVGHVVRLAAVREAGEEAGHPLTELEWLPADAVPADPVLTGSRLCVRVGNLVLADHGARQRWTPLPAPRAGQTYRPSLPRRHTTFSAGVPAALEASSAAEMLVPEGVVAHPAVRLRERIGRDLREWDGRASLFESGPLAADFVVEIGDDGVAALRFGDGVNGMRPPPGARFEVRQRVGGGAVGNVGSGAIAHVNTTDRRITGVTNPSAARGGAEPETLAAVRLNAPEAFRTTERVVEEADYVREARRVPGVADATAALCCGGSWPIALLYVHTGDWSSTHGDVADRVGDRIQARQPAGIDLQVRRAIPMPLAVELEVSVASGWDVSAVSAAIDRAIRGEFLRPGRFGFGDALHRSDLVTAVAAVSGVTDVVVPRFGWYREAPPAEPPDALLPPLGHILRVDNDVTRPERGSIEYEIGSRA
jgi:8-oxo-dGTP pyrophosphatase MutT (NUDIX family)